MKDCIKPNWRVYNMSSSEIKDLSAYLSLLDQVRSIGAEGLKYAKDPHDINRYTRLLEMSAQGYAGTLAVDEAALLARFRAELGILTPKVGVDVAVVNDRDQLLILKRTDDFSWCLPCGWADIGEGAAETAGREVREETGLIVEPAGYIHISHKGPHTASYLQHQVNIIVLMKTLEAMAEIRLSHEHAEYQWISDGGGISWHPGHEQQCQRIFAYLQGDRRKILDMI